ncbi:MAG: Nramp family divalent metal transporter [Rubrobacteraceae bacterium]
MAETTGAEREPVRTEAAPSTLGGRLRYVGPGLVIAATGVGAGDMVSALAAGTGFGTALLWAIVAGAVLKYFLTEGIGRYYMATGETILEGWRSLGWFANGYFGVYLLLQTFAFGAAGPLASALAVSAMFPDALPLWAWAMIHSLFFGFFLVIIGRYGLFEKVMEVFVGIMFLTVVGLAILLAPNLADLSLGLVPRIPEGSLINVLAIMGGVGGTFTLASYTYWARERGWRSPAWIPTMRTDLTVGYIVTGLFMVAMLVIGTELLFVSGEGIEGEAGLVALSDPIAERFGAFASWMFLIGFWAAATSSILGAWNGGAHLFGDYARTLRNVPDEDSDEYLSEKSPYFRAGLAWMTFPPMIFFFFGQPVLVVIVYASLGALFYPFLAVTLLWLLGSRRVGERFRNGIVANVVLGASLVLFVFLAARELIGLF